MLDGYKAIHLVSTGFNSLIELIGYPATFFLASLFFLILVRICVSFVFKLFRLNINYRSLQDKNDRFKADDLLKEYRLK